MKKKNNHTIPFYVGYYSAGVASGAFPAAAVTGARFRLNILLFRLGCDFCVHFKGLSWQRTASSGAFILASLSGI